MAGGLLYGCYAAYNPPSLQPSVGLRFAKLCCLRQVLGCFAACALIPPGCFRAASSPAAPCFAGLAPPALKRLRLILYNSTLRVG